MTVAQDLSILLNELELLREQNEFLRSLVDSQNLILQKTEEELENTQRELQQTNEELCEAFAEVELGLIKIKKLKKELTKQRLAKLFITINDYTISQKN